MSAAFATTSFASPELGNWRHLSLALAWLATAGLAILPLMTTVLILFPGHWSFHVDLVDPQHPLTGATPLPFRFGILLCETIPTGIGMWGLWSMRQLFLGYAHGEVFSKSSLRYLKNIALALLLGELTNILVMAPASGLQNWHLGPGLRTMSVGLGSSDFEILFLAGVAFVIARVMAEAQRIAADHAEIV